MQFIMSVVLCNVLLCTALTLLRAPCHPHIMQFSCKNIKKSHWFSQNIFIGRKKIFLGKILSFCLSHTAYYHSKFLPQQVKATAAADIMQKSRWMDTPVSVGMHKWTKTGESLICEKASAPSEQTGALICQLNGCWGISTKRNVSAAQLGFDLQLLLSVCRAQKLWFPHAPPTEQKKGRRRKKKKKDCQRDRNSSLTLG